MFGTLHLITLIIIIVYVFFILFIFSYVFICFFYFPIFWYFFICFFIFPIFWYFSYFFHMFCYFFLILELGVVSILLVRVLALTHDFLSDELDQFRLWKADPVQTRANHDAQVFSCNLCARTLPQILHRDLDIQYFLKIPKSQELVKCDIANDILHYIVYCFKGLEREDGVTPIYL